MYQRKALRDWLRLFPLLCAVALFGNLGSAEAAPQKWVGTWSAPLSSGGPVPGAIEEGTLRQIVHVSVGGKTIRLRFSNEAGTNPLRISSARVALSAGGSAIRPETDRALSFNGRESVAILPGTSLLSDPLQFDLPDFADLAVSLRLPPQAIGITTWLADPRQTAYMVVGDFVRSPTLERPLEFQAWFFLAGVEVQANAAVRAVVALGDSITSGFASTKNANMRWPDVLARRLAERRGAGKVAVLNQGISGNRLLNPGAGPSALERFDRDVLSQSGVSHVIVLIGVNDLGRWSRPHLPVDEVRAQDLIKGMRQLMQRARAHKIRVIGATLLPFEGANYWSPLGEDIRQTVNRWIRHGKEFDGVIDFDRAVRDPSNPTRFLGEYDSGDHLHPNDAGMRAMGEAIDLQMLE